MNIKKLKTRLRYILTFSFILFVLIGVFLAIIILDPNINEINGLVNIDFLDKSNSEKNQIIDALIPGVWTKDVLLMFLTLSILFYLFSVVLLSSLLFTSKTEEEELDNIADNIFEVNLNKYKFRFNISLIVVWISFFVSIVLFSIAEQKLSAVNDWIETRPDPNIVNQEYFIKLIGLKCHIVISDELGININNWYQGVNNGTNNEAYSWLTTPYIVLTSSIFYLILFLQSITTIKWMDPKRKNIGIENKHNFRVIGSKNIKAINKIKNMDVVFIIVSVIVLFNIVLLPEVFNIFYILLGHSDRSQVIQYTYHYSNLLPPNNDEFHMSEYISYSDFVHEIPYSLFYILWFPFISIGLSFVVGILVYTYRNYFNKLTSKVIYLYLSIFLGLILFCLTTIALSEFSITNIVFKWNNSGDQISDDIKQHIFGSSKEASNIWYSKNEIISIIIIVSSFYMTVFTLSLYKINEIKSGNIIFGFQENISTELK